MGCVRLAAVALGASRTLDLKSAQVASCRHATSLYRSLSDVLHGRYWRGLGFQHDEQVAVAVRVASVAFDLVARVAENDLAGRVTGKALGDLR